MRLVQLGICVEFLTLDFNHFESAVDKFLIVSPFLIRVVVPFLEATCFRYGVSKAPGVDLPVLRAFVLVDVKHRVVRCEGRHDREGALSEGYFTHEHRAEHWQVKDGVRQSNAAACHFAEAGLDGAHGFKCASLERKHLVTV